MPQAQSNLEYVKSLSLNQALWWFIENCSQDAKDRTEIFFHLRERQCAIQLVKPLIETVKSLVSDIEAMQDYPLSPWFGGFTQAIGDVEAGDVTVKWVNLAISLTQAKNSLAEHEPVQ